MKKLGTLLLWICGVFLTIKVQLTDSVICYQCVDSENNGLCERGYRRMRNAARYKFDHNDTFSNADLSEVQYLKDCSRWGDHCSIEKVTEGITGSTVAYIRGCTNLADFSVTPRTSPVADNSTKCSVYYQEDNQNIVVCISVCNSDLCNGPQFVFKTTLCYQCADSISGGLCAKDLKGMLTQKDKFQHGNLTAEEFKKTYYLKNCTGVWGDKCYIEHIQQKGGTFSYIRGCTDGNLFSITDFPRKNFPADNQTTCAYRVSPLNVVVCLTMCQEDFCNGPQSVTSGVEITKRPQTNSHFIVLETVLFFLFIIRSQTF